MDPGQRFDKWMEDWGWMELLLVLVFTTGLLLIFDLRVMPQVPEGSHQPGAASPMYMQRDRTDPRMFFDPADSLPDESNVFKIAWISGSSVNIYPRNPGLDRASNLNDVLASLIDSISGKPVRVFSYFISAQRSLDFYFSILHAKKTVRPDLYIVSVNPYWQYNPWTVLGESNWHGAMVQLGWDRPFGRSLIARYAQPKDLGFALLSPLFQFSRRRYDGQLWWEAITLTKPQGRSAPAWREPMLWRWVDLRIAKEKRGRLENFTLNWVHDTLQLSAPEAGTIGWEVTDQSLKEIAGSGAAALIYLDPVNPMAMSDPEMAPVLREVQSAFLKQTEPYRQPRIRIHTGTLNAIQDPALFRDFLHLYEGELVMEFILNEIRRIPGLGKVEQR